MIVISDVIGAELLEVEADEKKIGWNWWKHVWEKKGFFNLLFGNLNTQGLFSTIEEEFLEDDRCGFWGECAERREF